MDNDMCITSTLFLCTYLPRITVTVLWLALLLRVVRLKDFKERTSGAVSILLLCIANVWLLYDLESTDDHRIEIVFFFNLTQLGLGFFISRMMRRAERGRPLIKWNGDERRKRGAP